MDASLVAAKVEYTRVSKLCELQITGILSITVNARSSEQLPSEVEIICDGSARMFIIEIILARTVSALFTW